MAGFLAHVGWLEHHMTESALIAAAAAGNSAVLKIFLDRGLTSIKNLHFAASKAGNLAVLDLLLEPEARIRPLKLYHAVCVGQVERVQAILSTGIDAYI